MKVVRLSALCTGWLYIPGNIPGTYFCHRLSKPQGHSAARRIMSMKNSNDTTRNQTCDLLACSTVHQPTASQLDSPYKAGCNRFWSKSYNWQVVKVLSVTLRPSQWTSVCIIYILQISEQGRYLVEQNTIGISKHLLLPCMYNHHIWITKDPRSPSKKGWGSSQFRQSASCSTYSDSRRQWRSSNLSARASAISWNWR